MTLNCHYRYDSQQGTPVGYSQIRPVNGLSRPEAPVLMVFGLNAQMVSKMSYLVKSEADHQKNK
jgi:hypothetical protein